MELDLRLLKQEKEIAIAETEVEIRKHMAPKEFYSLGEAQSMIPKEEILSRFLSYLDSQSTQTSFVYTNPYEPPHESVPGVKPIEPPMPTVMSNPNQVIGDFTSFLLKKRLVDLTIYVIHRPTRDIYSSENQLLGKNP